MFASNYLHSIYFVIVLLFQSAALYSQATYNSNVDSLNKIANNLAIKHPKRAERIANQALSVSISEEDLNGELASRLVIAKTHRVRGNYREVLNVLNPVLPKLIQIENIELVAEALNAIGIAHNQLGHDTIPLTQFIGESNYSDLKEISQSLKSIGKFYQKIDNYSKAVEFFTKSVRIDSLLAEPILMAESYTLLADSYWKKGSTKEALRFFLAALPIVKTTGNLNTVEKVYLSIAELNIPSNPSIAQSYIDTLRNTMPIRNNLVSNILRVKILSKTGNPDEALMTLRGIDKSSIENKELESYIMAIIDVSLAYKAKGDLKKARALLEEATMLSRNKLFNAYQSSLFNLSEVLTQLGAFQLANKTLQKYYSVKDSLGLTQQYSFSTAFMLDRKLDAYRKDSKIQGLVIENERIRGQFLIALIAIILPLLLVLAMLYIARSRVARALAQTNLHVEQQNEELNAINEQLLLSQQKLLRLNQTKDKLFSIVAHDLKSPLVALKTSVFNLRQSLEYNHEKPTTDLVNLEEALSGTINLINNLLFWALSQDESISCQFETFSVAECLKPEIASAQVLAGQKGIVLDLSQLNECNITTDTNMFLFVFRNILSNALKFTQAGGKIQITSRIVENRFEISIADSGKGIEPHMLDKIFELSEEKLAKRKGASSGTGLGLVLCKEFVSKMGGTIIAHSVLEQGTTFTIVIPLK